VYRLCGGDVSKQDTIWQMNEEDVKLAMYQRYVDLLNKEWMELE
jgi:hypothetical protein